MVLGDEVGENSLKMCHRLFNRGRTQTQSDVSRNTRARYRQNFARDWCFLAAVVDVVVLSTVVVR